MMTHSAPRKFSFDTVFDDGGAVVSAPVPTRRMMGPAEMDQLRAEGERSAVAQAEARTAQAMAEIAYACQMAMGALAKAAHDHREASAHLALAVGRKIADAALDAFPTAPVAAALTELAREIEAEPVLKVQVASDLVEPVRAAIERAAQAGGFPGAINITDDPSMPKAAFSLDWGEGRAVFDPEAAAARVAAALETALAAEGLHAEPLINEADHG